MSLLYFAYGSNLDKRQMKRRCPSSQLVGIAKLPGYRLAFTRYSTKRKGGEASIEQSQEDCVWGALYELTNEDVRSLDEHEDVPHSFRREKNLKVVLPDSQEAVVYTYVGNKTGYFAPHRDYMRQILNYARQVGLPAEYLDQLGRIPDSGG